MGRPKKGSPIEVAADNPRIDGLSEVSSAKKGSAPWRPASINAGMSDLDYTNYSYKLVRADADRVARHISEGWELVSAENGEKAYVGQPKVVSGVPLDTVRGNADSVLMRISKEGAKLREEHHEGLAVARLKGVMKKAKSETSSNTFGDASVKIGDREIKQIID